MTRKASSKKSTSQRPPDIDLGSVERILQFMNDHGLEEFEYEVAGLRLRLRKPSLRGPAGFPAAPEIIVAPAASRTASAPAGSSAPATAPAPEAEPARSEDLHIIKSPIVGTFYEAPSPGAAAFVKVGDHVENGQALCIIEAMKLMNEIESDAAGEIVRIYVANGQPVEYGESLFAMRVSRKK